MHRLNYCLLPLGLAMGMVLLSGCGEGVPMVDTEPVEGVVTLDGEPVPNATVLFSPVNEGQGTPATGMTDEQGVYTLTADPGGGKEAKPGAGTTPGEYNVGVIKTEGGGAASPEQQHKQALAKEDDSGKGKAAAPEVTHVVPEKYNSPQNSGIKVTVTEGQNDIPIELSAN